MNSKGSGRVSLCCYVLFFWNNPKIQELLNVYMSLEACQECGSNNLFSVCVYV